MEVLKEEEEEEDAAVRGGRHFAMAVPDGAFDQLRPRSTSTPKGDREIQSELVFRHLFWPI